MSTKNQSFTSEKFNKTAKEVTRDFFKKSAAQVGTLVIPKSVSDKVGQHEGLCPIDPTPKAKDKRPSPLTLRATAEQRAAIKIRAAKAGLSVNRYLLLQACGPDLVPVPLRPEDRAERAALLRVFRGTGNLLNQIAKRLNCGQVVGTVEIDTAIKQHEQNAATVLQAFTKGLPE